MRHDWIFDVLTDLRRYALQNELRDLAEQVEVTLRTARRDVAAAVRAEAEAEAAKGDDIPPQPRRH